MQIAKIQIPPPHPKQAEIEACKKKRILINAGRRAGKTFMVARMISHRAALGRRQFYVAPVKRQTDAVWDNLKEFLQPAIQAGLIKKNENERTLLFYTSGALVECRTGHKPDHLRGGWGHDIYLDEYAYQDPVIYEKVCLPMALDKNGTIVFISTPDFRNHFYTLYLKALDNPRWAVFTFSSLDNPFLSEEALEAMIEDMTENDYKAEILAEFLPGVGAVFILDPDDFYNPVPDLAARIKPHKDHRLIAGLDWGRKQDYTVFCVGCADCETELVLMRTNEIMYHYQREMIADILQICKEVKTTQVEILAEENSMGLPNIEQMQLDGIDVEGFTTNNSSKAIIVQALRLAFQQHSWKWIHDPIAWNELEAFEMSITGSGLAKYGAPEGLHDDTVMARMLMLHQALTGKLQYY